MRLEFQEFPVDADRDVIPVASSGTNDNDLTYLESCKNLLENHDTNLELLTVM